MSWFESDPRQHHLSNTSNIYTLEGRVDAFILTLDGPGVIKEAPSMAREVHTQNWGFEPTEVPAKMAWVEGAKADGDNTAGG